MIKNWLTFQGPESASGFEWLWVVARAVVVITVAWGTVNYLGESSAEPFILGVVYLVLFYDAALALLIKAGRGRTAFFAGFMLDHVVMLTAWWHTTGSADPNVPDEFYLVLFPILVVGAARVGWAMGGAYSILLTGWMAFSDLRYQSSDIVPIEQAPQRVVSLVLIATLMGMLIYQVHMARRRVERERETIESVQRSMTEGLVVVNDAGIIQFCNPAATAICGIANDPPGTSDQRDCRRSCSGVRLTGTGSNRQRAFRDGRSQPPHRRSLVAASQRTPSGNHRISGLGNGLGQPQRNAHP